MLSQKTFVGNPFLDGWTTYRHKALVNIRLEGDIHLYGHWKGVSDALHQLAKWQR